MHQLSAGQETAKTKTVDWMHRLAEGGGVDGGEDFDFGVTLGLGDESFI